MKKLLQLVRESLADTERDYTRMGVRRAIVLLSIPMVLELSMESLFALVDAFFVGRIGTSAVAAVGLTESVMVVVYSIAWGLSMGVTALVSRRVGEKDAEGASRSAMQGIWVGLLASLLLGSPMLFQARHILTLMGASDAVLQQGGSYATILFGGNLVIMGLFVINAIFRGAGNAAMAM
nr:MATE family efflux transporter [Flavobacteriales bacterium]